MTRFAAEGSGAFFQELKRTRRREEAKDAAKKKRELILFSFAASFVPFAPSRTLRFEKRSTSLRGETIEPPAIRAGGSLITDLTFQPLTYFAGSAGGVWLLCWL